MASIIVRACRSANPESVFASVSVFLKMDERPFSVFPVLWWIPDRLADIWAPLILCRKALPPFYATLLDLGTS